MKKIKLLLITILFLPIMAMAAVPSVTHSLVAVQGYDVVSYFNDSEPLKGNGNNTAVYKNITYLFADKANKQAFLKEPAKYLPQYGGYCAFAASQGRKVIADPLAWKIVDGKLYLNLNDVVQKIWEKNIPGYIEKANKQWPKIADIPYKPRGS